MSPRSVADGRCDDSTILGCDQPTRTSVQPLCADDLPQNRLLRSSGIGYTGGSTSTASIDIKRDRSEPVDSTERPGCRLTWLHRRRSPADLGRSPSDMKFTIELHAGDIFGGSYEEDFGFLPGLHYEEALSQLKSLPEITVHDTNTLHQGWWIRFASSNCEYLLVTPSPEVSTLFSDSNNTTKADITSQLIASLTLIATYFADESHADKIDHSRLNQLTAEFLLTFRRTKR